MFILISRPLPRPTPASRLNYIPIQAPKFRFRGQAKDVTLALRMNQVHVNAATVQAAEVKGRTGHSGFNMQEVTEKSPPRRLNSQTHKGPLVPPGGPFVRLSWATSSYTALHPGISVPSLYLQLSLTTEYSMHSLQQRHVTMCSNKIAKDSC